MKTVFLTLLLAINANALNICVAKEISPEVSLKGIANISFVYGLFSKVLTLKQPTKFTFTQKKAVKLASDISSFAYFQMEDSEQKPIEPLDRKDLNALVSINSLWFNTPGFSSTDQKTENDEPYLYTEGKASLHIILPNTLKTQLALQEAVAFLAFKIGHKLCSYYKQMLIPYLDKEGKVVSYVSKFPIFIKQAEKNSHLDKIEQAIKSSYHYVANENGIAFLNTDGQNISLQK